MRAGWALLAGCWIGASDAQPVDPPLQEYRARFDPGRGFQLGRQAVGLLDLGDTTIVVGGSSYRLDWARSRAVDELGIDGSVRHLPNLRHARYHAQVFRLRDGALVVAGGRGESDELGLPLEWLPPERPDAGWQVFEMPPVEAWAQLADGDLVAIQGKRIERLRFEPNGSSAPTLSRSLFATPERERAELGERTRVVARGLADGRLVIADGQTQPYRIAIAPADDADAGEGESAGELTYTGFGPWSHARDYDIYDPLTRAWQTSVPARLPRGGPMQILADGRVLRPGNSLIPPGASTAAESAVELSLADASGWEDLPAPDIDDPVVVARDDRIYAHGRVRDTAEHTILRLDEAEQQWLELWRGRAPGNEPIDELLLLIDVDGTRALIPAVERPEW